jgi:hypothetical protein
VKVTAEFAGPVFFGAGHEDLAAGVVGAFEQGQQTAAAFHVEFAHDVVDQEDGRGAVETGEVFGLGHFQGDGERPFLAFAAVLGSGAVVQLELKLVAMWADERGAIGAFTGAGLGEFDGKIFFDARLVFEAKFLGIVGDPTIGEAGERRQLGNQFMPHANEVIAEFHQLRREAFECEFVHDALLEQSIARAECTGVTLQQRQISGMCLRQQQVNKAASRAGGSFDQLKVFGAEDDNANGAEVIGQFADRLVVQAEFALGIGPIHFDFVFTLPHDLAADEVAFLAVPNHLRAANTAERAQRGHQIDCFQDIGLALGVVAKQNLESWSEINVQPRVIAEVAKSEMSQMHLYDLRQGGRLFNGFEVVGGRLVNETEAPLGNCSEIWLSRTP